MATPQVFRDKPTAMAAAMLAALELADSLASTHPDDEVLDQGTFELFGAAITAAIVGSCVSLIRHRPVPHRKSRWWTGLGVIWVGAAMNRTARRQLGSAYRSRVTVVSDHQIVRGGLYRHVRHPMYSGAALICTGGAMVVDSRASVLWALPIVALARRIEVEESTLWEALGADYADFVDGRARLVPGVW